MDSSASSISLIEDDLNIPLTDFNKLSRKDKRTNNKEKQPNMNYDGAGLFSFVFFWWSCKAITLSNQGKLKISDVSYLSKSQKTEENYIFLTEVFQRYSKWRNKKNALLYALFRVHLCSFFSLLIFNLFDISLQYAHIYFFKNVIQFFAENEEPTYLTLKQNITGLIFSKVFSTIISNHIKFFEVLLGERITNQVNAMIFNKTLRSSIVNDDKSRTEAEKINLIDVDAERIGFLFFIGPKLLVCPLDIVYSFWMLFNLFGYNFLFGFSCLCLFLGGILALQTLFLKNQKNLLRKKDEVMGIQTHVFHILKMLKMYGWDDKSINEINKKKNQELYYLKKSLDIIVIRSLLNSNLSLIILIGTLGRYAYIDEVINISTVFTAMQLVIQLTRPLTGIPMFLTNFFSNLLSIHRIQDFLLLKDHNYTQYQDSSNLMASVKYSKCTFGVTINSQEKLFKGKGKGEKSNLSSINVKIYSKPNKLIFLNNISCEIQKGEFVAVIGQTGAGKSCFIGSIMNNYDLLSKESIIINGSISYASQSPWIINETIKNNILFFKEYDEAKYQKVVSGCQLIHDLKQFTHSDLTEISSEGTTLSGGQKARLSLARAVYQDADIYLLDDSLASVDSKVSNLIFKDIFCNYLQNKTRIFVTNTMQQLEYADKIIFLEKGFIKWMGTYSEFKKTYEEEFYEQTITKEKEKEKEGKEITNSLKKKSTSLDEVKENGKINAINMLVEGKLIKNEEINKEQIPLSLYFKFIKLQGGYFFALIIIFLSFATQVSKLFRDIHVTNWFQNASSNDNTDTNSNLYNFLIYVELSAVGIITQFIIDFLVSKAVIRTLQTLFQSMIYKLVKAPINLFHDIVPIGRILNRLSKDLHKVHLSSYTVNIFIESNLGLIVSIYICYIYNPYSLLVSPFLLGGGIIVTRYYISAGRNLDRLHRISFSPVLNFLSESILGVETIRASNNEDNMRRKFYEKLDNHYAVHIFDEGAEKWYAVALDLISHTFYSLIIIFVLYFQDNFSAQAIGLILTYSATFSKQLITTLESSTLIEKGMVSLERCDAYTLIPSEKDINITKSEVREDSNWPEQGVINFINYSARYRPNTNRVLHQINLNIKSAEKIGIVGRTGSGKSTLSIALSRIIEAEEGSIEIDGVDISKLNLEYLRRQICIVPQDPFVLNDTLRNNLDPLHKCSDLEIITVLDQTNLFSDIPKKERLDLQIQENGVNLSLGQKQLIGFARAVLKKSKIIVLDEATSNLDIQTESLVKSNLKTYFKNSTILIIAHRLQMVNDCDRILVIENGKIAETGTYESLLKNQYSLFYSLYLESQSNN